MSSFRDSFCACLKKCNHNILIVNASFLFFLIEAIINKIVQNGSAFRENIHAQLNTPVVVHILNVDFFVVQYFVLDQPILNCE